MRAYKRLEVNLPKPDERSLVQLLRSGVQQVRVVLRSLALLQLSDGDSAPVIARRLRLTPKTVRDIGKRYLEGGVDRALYERPRQGAKPILSPTEQQRIIAMACSEAPDGRARWTVRLIAEQAIKRKLVPEVGRETIRILLESHDLKPWREKMWCVAELNEEYIRKLEDVLELYERPYNQAEPVVCLDEKPVTLHKDVRSPKPPAPGQVAKRDSEYERCGTANVFCAVEPRAGRHYTRPTPDRCAAKFAQFMAELALNYPTAQTIHLVVDNLNIHCQKSLTDYYGEIPGAHLWNRFTVHYTPKHGSWLNQAEIEISLFSRQCLGTRRLPTLGSLRVEARAWNATVNEARTKINWQFNRREARRRFGYKKYFSKRS